MEFVSIVIYFLLDNAATIAGLYVTLILGVLVGPLVRFVKNEGTAARVDSDVALYREYLKVAGLTPKYGPMILGYLECLIIFAGLIEETPIVVAGWLGFKVAAKWQVWQQVIRTPDFSDLKTADQLAYLKLRHAWGSRLLMSFLIGTAGNILAAMTGVAITNQIQDWLSS